MGNLCTVTVLTHPIIQPTSKRPLLRDVGSSCHRISVLPWKSDDADKYAIQMASQPIFLATMQIKHLCPLTSRFN